MGPATRAAPVLPSAGAAAAAADSGCGGGGSEAGVAVGRVDREKGTVVYERYYHLFREPELRALARGVPGVAAVRTFYDKDNWCLVMSKA